MKEGAQTLRMQGQIHLANNPDGSSILGSAMSTALLLPCKMM